MRFAAVFASFCRFAANQFSDG